MHRNFGSRLFLVLSLGVFLDAACLFAQSGNSGTINGVVKDPSGAVIAGATVSIHNPVSGYDRTTTTDSTGIFTFSNIPPNPYHLSVGAKGFAPYAQDVDVRSSVPVAVSVALSVAGVYRYVQGHLRRNRERVTVLGLNENHNHDLKNLFKSAAISASTRPVPFQEFYAALLAKGRRPAMARLTLARKIAAITPRNEPTTTQEDGTSSLPETLKVEMVLPLDFRIARDTTRMRASPTRRECYRLVSSTMPLRLYSWLHTI